MFKILFVLCCGLGALAMSPEAQDTDAADEDEPSLLQMLEYFKGKSDMTLMVNLLKQVKVGRALGQSLFGICPQCKQVFEAAAKTNVAFRILGKMIEGQMPDLRDMYDLATKGTGDISGSYTEATRKNKKYNMFIQALLSNSSRSLSSTSQIEQDLNIFTGRVFKLDSVLVKGVYDGSVKVTKNNLVQVNLLQIMSSWKKNFALFNKLIYGLMKLPTDFMSALAIIDDFDFSNLLKIKIINGGMNNSKYTVVGGMQTMVEDPDVVKMMQDHQQIQQLLKAKSHNQATAEALILDTVVTYMKVTTRVIKDAESDRKLAPI